MPRMKTIPNHVCSSARIVSGLAIPSGSTPLHSPRIIRTSCLEEIDRNYSINLILKYLQVIILNNR